MLLGGKRAAELAPRLQAIGMNATAVSDQIGVASAIKMCRSVMIKGLEALAIESLFAARRYGAEDAVLASLEATFPSMGWNAKLPDYLISRVAEHGRRRAAEMREAALAVADVGLAPLLTERTAKRHDWLVDEIAAQGVNFDAGGIRRIVFVARARRCAEPLRQRGGEMIARRDPHGNELEKCRAESRGATFKS